MPGTPSSLSFLSAFASPSVAAPLGVVVAPPRGWSASIGAGDLTAGLAARGAAGAPVGDFAALISGAEVATVIATEVAANTAPRARRKGRWRRRAASRGLVRKLNLNPPTV